MKKGSDRRTFSDAFDHWVDAHRPTLFHPGKSWLKYLSLKATTGVVRGSYRLTRAAVRETYYAMTPEQLPDARLESSEELWNQLAATNPIEIPRVVADITAKIPQKLTLHDKFVAELIAPDLTPPEFPENGDAIAHATWRDAARRYLDTYYNGSLEMTAQPILAAIERISQYLPPASKSDLRIHVMDLIPNIPKTVEEMIRPFYAPEIVERGLFKGLRERLDTNACNEKGDLILPTQANKIEPRDIPKKYLAGTPLLSLFNMRVPLSITEEVRFSHTWLVAGSGHGKTTYMAGLLKKDIEAIKRGERSAIVIDSQYTIIPQLMRLDCPKVVIDPTDIQHPVALNLFDIGLQHAKDEMEQEALLANAIEMFGFVFAALLEQDMTTRQATMFSYMTKLLITQVKNATINDFNRLLNPRTQGDYAKAWNRMAPDDADYFKNDFSGNEVKATREQVRARLRTLLARAPLVRMLSAPETKLNLFEEMDAGKLILINTDKDALSEEGMKVFGRFWIAQILLAAQRRARSKKMTPTFVYIDEAQDYLAAGDQKITTILEQARKRRVGLMIIHHFLEQFQNRRLLAALSANTAIKLCGSPEHGDAVSFASMMRTTKEFIEAQKPRQSLACYVRAQGFPGTAFSLAFPNTRLDPELSDEQFSVMIQSNREKYCYSPQNTAEHSDTEEQSSEDDGDADRRAKEW